MTPPVIIQIVGEPSGTLKGKAAVGAHGAKGLQLNPNLHLELISTLTGIDSNTLYDNHQLVTTTGYNSGYRGEVVTTGVGWGADTNPKHLVRGPCGDRTRDTRTRSCGFAVLFHTVR